MFEEWKQAWRAAVDNFERELHGGGPAAADERVRSMRRVVKRAREELERIEAELSRAKGRMGEECERQRVCRRREAQARRIGDDATARLAAEFAARHAERAGVLEHKVEVLEAECALSLRDLDAMEEAFRRHSAPAADAARADEGEDDVFENLERRARERAAAERVEALKRRTRP